jgi:hypothetical protein
MAVMVGHGNFLPLFFFLATRSLVAIVADLPACEHAQASYFPLTHKIQPKTLFTNRLDLYTLHRCIKEKTIWFRLNSLEFLPIPWN